MKSRTRTLALILFAIVSLLLATSLSAQVNGAIFTTTSDGTVVNGNIYSAKSDVYLNGGPQNEHQNGLTPDGTYYFQVTDPSGAVLLSTDGISCREVTVSGGRITGATGSCPHANGTQDPLSGQTPVQLIPYNDTPNSGGEYKVWLTPVANYSPDGGKKNNNCSSSNSNITFGFCDSDSKTDNFKVQTPKTANVTVCKFNDQNADGVRNNGEPLLAHWPITATGVDGGTVTKQTDDHGCVSFTFSGFSDSVQTDTVTLTEGTQGSDWTQTAPADGTCAGVNNCTISGGVITLILSPNDKIDAPNFGNFSPTHCGNGCPLVVTKNAYPSFTRAFKWAITKDVDQTHVNTSGSATFNYTVSVTHDAGTDSGWQATGEITVSNPSPADFTNVTVTDAVDNGGNCSVTGGAGITIPANSHVELPYVCTYDALPAAGTNTATATWDSNSTSGTAAVDFAKAVIHSVDDSVTVTDSLGGSLGTVKSTDASPTTFTYPQTFTDPAGTCTTHDNTATFTTNTNATNGSDSKSVTVCVGSDLIVRKDATATFSSDISKSVDKTQVNQAPGSTTFNYTVNVTTSAWTVAGNITVTNPNDWEAVTANVADALSDSGGACTINGGNTSVTVAASSSQTLPYSCTFAAAPTAGSGSNTATATWDSSAAFTLDSSTTGTASYAFGSLTVTDTFNGATNTLGKVSIPPATTTFTYTRTVTAPTGTCTTYPNTATITETGQTASQSVKVCVGADLTVSKTAAASFDSSITKSVDKTLVKQAPGSSTFNYTVNVATSGWKVVGNITVNNPNDWESVTANVADALNDAGGNCTVAGGGTVTVAPSSSQVVSYSCSFASAPSLGSGTNTATASWDPAAFSTAGTSASGTAGYAFGSLTVTDTFNGATNTLGTLTIPPGSATFTYSRTVTAPVGTCTSYPNTATITETGATASQSVKVCVGADLTVSKTAAGSFNSGIKKSVNKTLVEQANGTFTFQYTVNVTESGWGVAGNITVTNPNDWEAVTVNVADVLSDAGGACTVANGGVATVAAGSSSVLPYTCSFAGTPTAASGSNNATATWDPALAFTTHGSGSGSAGYSFQSLTVTDTFAGTLGTILQPAASTTFTYSRTVNNAVGGQCASFPNTATITQTGQSSSQTATICNTATGALTMGFWQNKNGQGIITGGASTAGVCNSGAFLRNFAPFQDLSATATCAQVGSYVTNIIKAANSSGASMNAMLKAQMLATALDVFFSDPTLGGNKIGAATPIGLVKIDLTQVCNMLDGSSGSASCSGSFINVSSAFGGASSMTVINMLVYASGQSNAGGSLWYGNNKSVQALAKDVFDAINNQAAYIAP